MYFDDKGFLFEEKSVFLHLSLDFCPILLEIYPAAVFNFRFFQIQNKLRIRFFANYWTKVECLCNWLLQKLGYIEV